MTRAVVWDLDGVLADNDHAMSGKQLYDDLTPAEWEHLYASASACALQEMWATLWHVMAAQQIANIIITNRPERQREVTRDWLARHRLFPEMLLMRDESAPQGATKVLRLVEIRRAGYTVIMAVEDDPAQCADYRSVGVPALHVPTTYHPPLPTE